MFVSAWLAWFWFQWLTQWMNECEWREVDDKSDLIVSLNNPCPEHSLVKILLACLLSGTVIMRILHFECVAAARTNNQVEAVVE